MAQRKEIDIGLAGFTLLKSRAKVVDYTLPLYLDANTFCTATVPQQKMNFMAYIDTVHLDAWIATGAYILVLSICFTLFAKVISFYWSEHYNLNFISMIAMICIIILQRDLPINKQNNAVKILHLFTCFLGIFLFAAYSAVLTSLMTSSPKTVLFQSFKEAYDKG